MSREHDHMPEGAPTTIPPPPLPNALTTAPALDRNLTALARTSPDTVARIRASPASWDAAFHPCPDGLLALTLSARAMCSRRRPAAEAEAIASQIDIAQSAAVIVMGFGAGHHVAALARRMRKSGVLVVFEPDVALLRSVLERIDHSQWLRDSNVAILTDPHDGAAMSQLVRGVEGLFMMGLALLEHPPSAERLGERKTRFYENFQQVVGAVRTQVATTMVQVKATLHNLLMNVGRYATCEGIADLKGAAAKGGGRLGIVVSAGPSLARNIDQLEPAWVRERCVIIAAQTVLKTLLACGIRPHFVTALDHAEISARFYEGLTASDVEGVTLVVEPKANPAILEAFPGRIRCVADGFLDTVLGDGLKRERGSLTPGATVAHLAYYLARHLGCDPVALVGQDLGFTDGQYYGAGAAIHDVWACELNEFNTLEMMEWQRIKRMGSHLRRTTDALGRPVYTDEQMAAYLVQFERDFRADTERGLTVIDATEGGVAKAHTVCEPLAAVLARQRERTGCHCSPPPGCHCSPCFDGAAVPNAPNAPDAAVLPRLRDVRAGIRKVEHISTQTAGLLRQMLEHFDDRARVNRFIQRVHGLAADVERINPGYRLVHYLNQTGAFNRIRADRAIELGAELTALDKQRLQIERDLANVDGLEAAARELGELLDECAGKLQGRRSARLSTPITRAPAQPRRVTAMIVVDPARSALGTPRDLASALIAGRNPLRLTLERLARCTCLDGAVLLTDDIEAVRRLIGGEINGLRIRIEAVEAGQAAEGLHVGPEGGTPAAPPWLRAARLWSRDCWRAGLGGATCYDEVLRPRLLAAPMSTLGIDGALIVGDDWCFVDPALCDAAIERFSAEPGHQIGFTQAPPGLSGFVVGRALMETLAGFQTSPGPASRVTLGTLLSYHPRAPALDIIGTLPPSAGSPQLAEPFLRAMHLAMGIRTSTVTLCAPIDPAIRDCGLRFMAEHASSAERLRAIAAQLGDDFARADAGRIVQAAQRLNEQEHAAPWRLCMDITTSRRTQPVWAANPAGEHALRVDEAIAALQDAVSRAGTAAVALTLGNRADPLLHPDLPAIIRAAREAGIAGIHLRTDLVSDPGELESLPWREVDVVSINLMATTRETYRRLMGVDLFDRVRANLERLLRLRDDSSSGTPWIVPRITRCDATCAEIESFFDHWLAIAGAAVIDPLPAPIPGDRIAPLPLPESACRRLTFGLHTVC